MKTLIYSFLPAAMLVALGVHTSTFAASPINKVEALTNIQDINRLTELEKREILRQDARGNKNIQRAQNEILAQKANNNEVAAQLYALRTLVSAGEQMQIQAVQSADVCYAVAAVNEISRLMPSTYLEMPDPRLTTPEVANELSALIQLASTVLVKADALDQRQGCIFKKNDMCCNESGWQAACQTSQDDDCHVVHGLCSVKSDKC